MLPTPLNQMANNQPDNSADKNKQKGTGFTNIGNILNANQGAGQKIGQSLGSSLTGQANSVKAGIDSSQNQFNTQSNQAKDSSNNAIQAGQQYVRGPGTDDTTYLNNLNNSNTDYSKIGKDINSADYNGPMGLNNADQLNTQAANVSALGRLAGTSQGQSQLLRSQVAQKGNYSQGQNALDSLLLGNQGQQYVQQGRSDASNIGQLANNASANATSQANALKGAIANNKSQLLQNLNSSLTGSGTVDSASNPQGITGLETDATNAATAYTNQAQRLQQLLRGTDANGNTIKGSDVTDADKALLNNINSFGQTDQNIDQNLYVDPNDPSSAYNALDQLSGKLTTQGLGSQLYTAPQQTAATNLAKLLQDSQSQQNISNNQFNKQILANNSDEGNIFGALNTGIQGNIANNQANSNALAQLSNNYRGTNVDQVSNDRSLQEKINGQGLGSLQDAFNKLTNITGQNAGNLYNSRGNKDLGGFFGDYAELYGKNASTLQNQFNNNQQTVTQAALKRLLGNT